MSIAPQIELLACLIANAQPPPPSHNLAGLTPLRGVRRGDCRRHRAVGAGSENGRHRPRV